MGFFDFIAKAADTIVPLVLESINETNSKTDDLTDSVDDLVEKCESLLDCIKKASLEDDDEIIALFRNADRRIFKLDRMSIKNPENCYLQGELERLQEKREKLLEYITEQYQEILEQLSTEGKAISDPDLYFENNDKWEKFYKKSNHLLEYQIEYTEKLGNHATDFLNE